MATGISKTKWNGDIEDEAALPGSSVETSLTYSGKSTAKEIVATKPTNLKRLWQNPVNRPNRLYYGDNLSILASLLHDPTVKGKVKLIYIDPPFATKSVFQSRSQNDAYHDLLDGAHYLEFMRKRLVLLRELLAEDGSIYIHLDMNMAFHIKIIMDEIFGQKNFRNWITRKKCNPKNYTRKTYGNISDFILFYTKSDDYIWNRPYAEWTPEQMMKEYQYVEEETGRRYKKVPIHAPGVRNGETGQPWRGKNPPPGKHWQYTPKKLDEMDARGEIYWSPNGNPRRKVYFDESSGIPLQDIWLDFRDAHNQNIKITGYPTEKNPDMLSVIIKASSNPDDIVLDCFCGSGSTLDVASQLKRKWIGIDNSQTALDTILHRFAKGLEPMGDFVNTESTANQLALFDVAQHDMINDFSLFAAEPYNDELNFIVDQWQSWQSPEGRTLD